MFDKCILHIGTEKTGTTSIQEFLHANRTDLLEQGFYIPRSMGRREHVGLVCLFAASQKRFSTRTTLGHHTIEQVENHKRQLNEEIRAEMMDAAVAGRTLVVSAERFFTVISSAREIEELGSFLYEYCREVEIICYIRPQHEFAISMFSTNIKNGISQSAVLPDLARNVGMARKCDYDGVISFWETFLPDAKFKIGRFVKNSLVDGDVVADFSRAAGISSEKLLWPKRQNEALSWKAQLFAINLNAHMMGMPREKFLKNRRKIFRILRNNFSGPGILPARAAAAAFFENFTDSNERLRSRFFSGDATLFDVSFDKYPLEEDDYQLKIGDAFEIFAKILQKI